jgi:hypothetical protein
MATTETSRTPVHLWIVGILSTLWNAFGCYNYLMAQTGRLADLEPEMQAWMEGFDTWMNAAWAVGVWFSLLGSLLLLGRSRYAVHTFWLSLAGLAVNSFAQVVLNPPPGGFGAGDVAILAAIWAILIGLLVYAKRMRQRGVLR